jgi:hypothetical protein
MKGLVGSILALLPDGIFANLYSGACECNDER